MVEEEISNAEGFVQKVSEKGSRGKKKSKKKKRDL